MANFGIGEIYGYPVSDFSQQAQDCRSDQRCPFIDNTCNKTGGVCCITDGTSYPIVCPRRFQQDNVLYREVAIKAFGTTDGCAAIGEVNFLESVKEADSSAPGKIDNIIVRLGEDDEILDWCALEVQAVYFSGMSMRQEINQVLQNRTVPTPASRRPDFRSSGPKRLLPQLEIKVPTLRRWGKKMFVAIDDAFFSWLPEMESANDLSNADICWMGFGLERSSSPYRLILKKVVATTLEESRISLVAGSAPPIKEFESAIASKMAKGVVWSSSD